jgi:hypothetical protein
VRVNRNQCHHRPRITEGGHRIHLGIPTMIIGEKNIWTELPKTGIIVSPTLGFRNCRDQRHILDGASDDDSRTWGHLREMRTYEYAWDRYHTLHQACVQPQENKPKFIRPFQFDIMINFPFFFNYQAHGFNQTLSKVSRVQR